MIDWSDLIDELDAWNAAGLTATFWWRDDDAVEPNEKLDRLLEVTATVPIALSVIPGLATKALAKKLIDCKRITVFQHGWRHENHGSSSNPSEYPGNRPVHDVKNELREGRNRILELFGEDFRSVFTPPWGSFDDRFLPLFLESGLPSISREGPRSDATNAAGIFELNVHSNLLIWREDVATFAGANVVIGDLLAHLRARRLSLCDIDEPTGILSHHLDQDSCTFDFVKRLTDVICGHNAAKWLHVSEIFAQHGRCTKANRAWRSVGEI